MHNDFTLNSEIEIFIFFLWLQTLFFVDLFTRPSVQLKIFNGCSLKRMKHPQLNYFHCFRKFQQQQEFNVNTNNFFLLLDISCKFTSCI